MNTIFRTNSPRLNNENQNNIMARKPGQSVRKPLADRAVRAQEVNAQAEVTQKCKEVKNDFFGFDICSYKDVPDNYNDLVGPAEMSNFSSINFAKRQKTPPPERRILDRFEPKLIEDSDNFNYQFLLNENFNDFPQDFLICDIGDAPLPELSFEF